MLILNRKLGLLYITDSPSTVVESLRKTLGEAYHMEDWEQIQYKESAQILRIRARGNELLDVTSIEKPNML